MIDNKKYKNGLFFLPDYLRSFPFKMKLKYLHFSLDTDGGCSVCQVAVIQNLDVVVYQYNIFI